MSNFKEKVKEAFDMLGIFVLAGVLTFFIGHYYSKAMHGMDDGEKSTNIKTEEKLNVKTTSKSVKIEYSLEKESE